MIDAIIRKQAMNHYSTLLVLILATGFSTVQANSMHSTITQSAADTIKYSMSYSPPDDDEEED